MPLKMYGQSEPQDNLGKVSNIIGVLGGKGGVGKSTVTVNLALALSQRGRRVGILDADVYGPSIRHLLGDASPPEQVGAEIIPAKVKGLAVISVAFFQGEGEASIVRAPVANQIIDQFLGKICWGELDDLLIDFPPGTGDIQITLMQKAKLTGAVVVTTPQEVALLDVRKSVQMCQRMDVPLLGVVENMSYFLHQSQRYALFGEGGGKLLSDEFEIPLLGQIPIDAELSRTGDEGVSLFETEAVSRSSFEEVAARLESRLKVMAPADKKPKEVELWSVTQVDQHHVEIKWSNDLVHRLRLSDLQERCPCARCEQEKREINPGVMAVKLTKVGNYGLKIQFTEGCSKGIYPFELLREISS